MVVVCDTGVVVVEIVVPEVDCVVGTVVSPESENDKSNIFAKWF